MMGPLAPELGRSLTHSTHNTPTPHPPILFHTARNHPDPPSVSWRRKSRPFGNDP